MLRVAAITLLLAACTPAQDPRAFLDHEASFLRPGVDLASEEREVRRVLGQRGMRVTGRVEQPGFVALGAASRRASAVRVITGRGVVVAEDAEVDDLFHPATLALGEGFTVGDYTLVGYARTPARQDVGCVTLERILPDATTTPCVIDSSDFGARACVASVSLGRNGALRAKIAWPSLHAYTTPRLDVELDFALQKDEQRAPLVRLRPGPWIDQETARYNAVQLSKADIATRHAVGVARAALAKLAGKSTSLQVDLYRNALGPMPPGSLEASLASETLRHIQGGWLDGAEPAEPAEEPEPPVEAPEPIDQPPPDDAIVVEPPPDTR
ncbi:MAG: hypothetical protein ABW352_01665 [Polyangiales bacterium]